MDKGAGRRKLRRKEVPNMLRVIVKSATINPPLSPPPRPCVSVCFRGEHQESGWERDPRDNTCSMKSIGLLVPYYVKDALSDRKLRWTPPVLSQLTIFITIILTFLVRHGYGKEKINTFLKLLISSFYEIGLSHKLKFKEKKIPAS